jgi:hypothetical protein
MKAISFVILCIMLLCISGCKVVAIPTEFTLTLYWTAPGDNGNTGTAAQYDLRYGTAPITDANWNSATQITNGVPSPSMAGTAEHATFTFLAESEVTIYFAIKAADEKPNWSPLSNVVAYLTPDIVTPAAIVDLRNTN